MVRLFEKKELKIEPAVQEIKNRLDQIRRLEKRLAEIEDIIEKRSYQRDYNSPADDVLAERLKKEIIDLAEQVIDISEKNNLDPRRFLVRDYIQAVAEKKDLKAETEQKAA